MTTKPIVAALGLALALAARAHEIDCEKVAGILATNPDGSIAVGPDGLPVFAQAPGPILTVRTYPAVVGWRLTLTNLAGEPSTVRAIEDPFLAGAQAFGAFPALPFVLATGAAATSVVAQTIGSFEECVALGGAVAPAGEAPPAVCAGVHENRLVATTETDVAECRARLACVRDRWRGVKQFGSSAFDNALSVAVAPSGVVVAAGDTHGDLGPGALGDFDAFAVAFGPGGERRWTRQFGTPAGDGATAVAVDAAGNAFVTGTTAGSLAGFPNRGFDDVFLTKLDAAGGTLWTQVLGTPYSEVAYAVAAGPGGDAWIAGVTFGSFTGGPNQTPGDGFLARFDGAGTLRWLRTFGTGQNTIPSRLAVDDAGNAYVTGQAFGALPGATSAGGPDAFVARFDADGNPVWFRQLGSASVDAGEGIAVAAGRVFVGAKVNGAGQLFAFDTAGTVLWSRPIGDPSPMPPSFTQIGGVAVDGAGDPYVAGSFHGTFEGKPAAGGLDAFLVKLDPAGNELWFTTLGSAVDELVEGLAVDPAGNAFLSGYTDDALGGPSLGQSDAFVAKFDPSGVLQ